jgi:pimeloyl-ACP methyl ester carboxylesterase
LVDANPGALEWLIVQNSNAYEVGFSAAWAGLRALWKDQSEATEGPLRALLARDTIKAIYLHGAKRPELVSPDAWESDIALLQRPHAERLHLDLFHDYRTNVPRYPKWQAFLRERQPETLIFWGQGDMFFTPAGGDAYLKDLPSAELHRLDAGHFAVEECLSYVAKHIELFYSARVAPAKRNRAA